MGEDHMLTPTSRRTFLRTTLLLSATALLSACGQSSPAAPKADPKPATEAKPAESKPAAAAPAAPAVKTGGPAGTVIASLGRDYLAYPDTKGTIQFSNCWGGARIPLIEGWINDFKAIYPGITIENDVTDCSPLREKQVTALAGGSPPNVMMIKSDNTAFFAEQNALQPIDDLMARDKVMKEWYYPGEFQTRQWQGKTYGLPNVTAGALSMLFVNTGLLEKIGVDPTKPIETWQDLDALVEPAKKAGLLVMDPAKISTGITAHQVWTYANGGKYWNDDLTKIEWDQQPSIEAADWLLNFVKAQGGKYENVATAADRKNVLQPEDWAPEKYVCCVNGSWFFFQLKQKVPNLNYATYSFPRNATNPNSKGATPTTGGWMFSIARTGKDQEAAWEWIKFTTASQSACTFVEKQNRPSPAQSCNENPALAQANPFWPVVTKTLSMDVPVPTTSIHPQFDQLWYDTEDAILFERQAPKAALKSSARRAQQMLDEWNQKQRKRT